MKSTFSLISIIVIFIIFFSDINHGVSVEFGYAGLKGPNFWHLLSNESSICETGKSQSPIDISLEELKILAVAPPLSFKDAKNVKSINNGNTIEITSKNEEESLPVEMTVAGETYNLLQFHFHTPSEHRINGRHSDIEQHLVFRTESGKISVVSILYDVGGKESEFIKPITTRIPKDSGNELDIEEIKFTKLFKDIKNVSKAYTYSGSLTTPPCTEGVTWYVNKDPLSVSFEQLAAFKNVMGFNSRFTQVRESGEEEEVIVKTLKKKKRSLYSRSNFKNL